MLRGKILECLELSVYAYMNESRDWKVNINDYDYIHFFEKDNAFSLITKKQNDLYLIFRGSNDFKDWQQNFDFGLTKFQDFEFPNGWIEHYNKLRDDILYFIANEEYNNLYVSGHSLGGAVSQIASIDITKNILEKNKRIINITFGSPKVLGDRYTKRYYQRNITGLHIQNSCDIVTRTPLFMKRNYKIYKVGKCSFWSKIFGSINAHYPINYKNNILKNKKLRSL